MTRTLVAGCVALILFGTAVGKCVAETFDLSAVAIRLPKKAKPEIVQAAEELKRHLQLIAGSEVDDQADLVFVFGRPADAPKAEPFESRYRIDGKTVWLWGDDGGAGTLDWGDDRGVTSRKRHGTLFAVSLFLEKEFGVRWLWPGEDGIDFEKRTSVTFPARREGVFRTALQMSRIRNYPAYGDGEAYRVATGFTPPELRDDGAYFRKSYEERQVWLRRQRLQPKVHFTYGHAFTKWKDRFERTHPDYLNWNAERKDRGFTGTGGRDRTKLCVSNEAVVDQIIADWLAEGTNQYLNVCENDSGNFCQCDGCRALDCVQPGEGLDDHMTDRYCNFWNRLARKARAIRPDVMLVAYAYARYRKPPRRERIAYPDNMLFGFVPMTLEDAKSMFVAWRERGMRHFFLRPNYHHYLGTIPHGMERYFYEVFHDCLDFGMIGVDYDACGRRALMDLEYYVTARMVADPSAAFEDICADFYAGYGAAAEGVRAYYELSRRHAELARETFIAAKTDIRALDDSQASILQCYGRTEEQLREELAVAERTVRDCDGKLTPKAAKRLDALLARAQQAVCTYRYLTSASLGETEYARRGDELVKFRIANKARLEPENFAAVFGSWGGEIRSWKRNLPYRVVVVDGGTLDPRGIRYGWSLNFEGMSYGRWRSCDRFSQVVDERASKGRWSCRLDASRQSGIRDDNLKVFPGKRYRMTADLYADKGAEGVSLSVRAYDVPEKGFKGGVLARANDRELPRETWVTRAVEFVAPTVFPESRRRWGDDMVECAVPEVKALGGAKGSAVYVDNICFSCLDE